jgi:hypothetical protein
MPSEGFPCAQSLNKTIFFGKIGKQSLTVTFFKKKWKQKILKYKLRKNLAKKLS